MLAILYPSTSPQTKQTVSLVNDLRDSLIPQTEKGSSLAVHIGGVTATDIDFSRVLTEKLPLFIAVVVFLAFLLLMAVFRSVLIPVVASIMNLLSIAAALGALNAVFNLGWGASLLGLTVKSPVDAFISVLMFSVLFGLSTDYGPKRQNHRRRSDHHGPGLRIVPTQRRPDPPRVRLRPRLRRPHRRPDHPQPAGPGVPAIMHRIGPANWAMPAWLDRIVPNLSIDATSDAADTPLPTVAGYYPADTPQVDQPLAVPADGEDPADTPECRVLAGVSSSTTADK
ncbi:MAG: MMPL family transporter [Solirubrobacteraceae bacterium]